MKRLTGKMLNAESSAHFRWGISSVKCIQEQCWLDVAEAGAEDLKFYRHFEFDRGIQIDDIQETNLEVVESPHPPEVGDGLNQKDGNFR